MDCPEMNIFGGGGNSRLPQEIKSLIENCEVSVHNG